jgi:hypothetical protein
MAEMMWVQAKTKLPSTAPAGIWDPSRVDDFESTEWEQLALLPLCHENGGIDVSVTVDGDSLTIAGSYSFGLTGFNDATSFESTCQQYAMPYSCSDDGGRYDNGTWCSWSKESGDVELPADSSGLPMITVEYLKKHLAELSDAELGARIRELLNLEGR